MCEGEGVHREVRGEVLLLAEKEETGGSGGEAESTRWM